MGERGLADKYTSTQVHKYTTVNTIGNNGANKEGTHVGTNLVCLYINARSIMNKLIWLEATLEAMNPDIIGITESWCNDAVGEAEMGMAGYDMFRADRSGGIKGGGVLLYTKSELGALYYKIKCREGEHICCRVPQKGKGEEIIIGVNYRSDNIQRLNFDTNVASRELIKELQPKNFVIMGDYNCPDMVPCHFQNGHFQEPIK